MSLSRHILRSSVVAGLAATTVAGVTVAADAHVHVTADTAEQGSRATLSFRVPNERDEAKTTKLEVDLPLDHPVASVSPRSMPGWTVKVEKKKLATPVKEGDVMISEAVSAVTWSGGSIDPDQFQEFEVSMSLPTTTNKMMFVTVQTYSGGEVVRWDQETKEGQEEPERPAPVLNLTPKGSGGDEHSGDEAAPAASPGSTVAVRNTASSATADDGTARLLGGAGIILGVIGVGVGVYGLRRDSGSGSGRSQA